MMESPLEHISIITGLVARVGTLQQEIKSEIDKLPKGLAAELVEGNHFCGFDTEGFAELDYQLLDRAHAEKIRTLFQQFPDLLYVTMAYCTDENESASQTGINGLVFGFLPPDHRYARIGSIRDFLLGNLEKLSARERLAFQSVPLEIPTFVEMIPLEEYEAFEEVISEIPAGFAESSKSLLKLSEFWFEAYENYFQDETDSILRYWRDGVTMTRSVWESW